MFYPKFSLQPREQLITSPLKPGDRVVSVKSNHPVGVVVRQDPGMIEIRWEGQNGSQLNKYELNFFIYNYRVYSDPNDILKDNL